MYDKKDIDENIDWLRRQAGLNPVDVVLIGSAAMVMLDMLPECNDLDIEVSPRVFGCLKKCFPNHLKFTKFEEGTPRAGKTIERIVFGPFDISLAYSPAGDTEIEFTNNVCHRTEESIVAYKTWLGRVKDIEHLALAGYDVTPV